MTSFGLSFLFISNSSRELVKTMAAVSSQTLRVLSRVVLLEVYSCFIFHI